VDSLLGEAATPEDPEVSMFAAQSAAPTLFVNWRGILAKGIIPRSADATPNL
jgi:hypothetical protein